jgi:hypothetical protein
VYLLSRDFDWQQGGRLHTSSHLLIPPYTFNIILFIDCVRVPSRLRGHWEVIDTHIYRQICGFGSAECSFSAVVVPSSPLI